MSIDPLIASGSSHQGAREYQEDRFEVVALAEGRTLLVVCDGMGGHANGAEAAQTVKDAFVYTMRQESGSSIVGQLKRSLDRANDAVARRARDHPDMRGMGCTLAAALADGDRVWWISVGDSPIWLIRGSKVERLNEDHSMGGYYRSEVEKGRMLPEEARQRGGFNELRSAVMGETLDLVDEGVEKGVPLKTGDAILVASDGILTLSEAETAAQIRGLDARQAAERLIDQVIECARPRQDNVTAALYWHRRSPRSEPGCPKPDRARRPGSWRARLGYLALAAIMIIISVLVLYAFDLLPGNASKPDKAKKAAVSVQ